MLSEPIKHETKIRVTTKKNNKQKGHSGQTTNVLTAEAYITVNVTAINHEPTMILSTDLIQMTEDLSSNFSIVVNDTDCNNQNCDLTISVTATNNLLSVMYPNKCPSITSNKWVSTFQFTGNVSEINQCMNTISIEFNTDVNGVYRKVEIP